MCMDNDIDWDALIAAQSGTNPESVNPDRIIGSSNESADDICNLILPENKPKQ